MPYRPPEAVGPSILWPLIVRKSQSSSVTSTGTWGTSWAPSTSTSAPTACAASTSSFTGGSVPSEFDMPVTASSFVRSVSSEPRSDRSSRPSSVSGMYRRVAPVSLAASCQGTMFEWCSISDRRISSPSRTKRRAHACATRFVDSVVPLVNTIVSGCGAPTNRASLARACS